MTQKYDLESESFTENPYPTYAAMRASDPIYGAPSTGTGPETVWSTGTAWYITRYDDCHAVLKDFRHFVKDFRIAVPDEMLAALPPMPPLLAAVGSNLIGTEPPEHTRLRALVSQAFSPRRVAEMAELVQQVADDLIDAMSAKGRSDLIEDFAYPLPIAVITGMLGLPLQDADKLRRWAEIKPPSSQEEAAAAMVSLTEAKAYIDEQIEARRSQPSDDLIAALIQAEIEGDRLDELQLFSMIMMIIVAGFETTVNLIGNGTVALLKHPEQMQLILEDPSMTEAAVEEMLRWDTPLEHALIRWVAEDEVELRGQTLRRGDRIVVVQAAANRDPEKFEDPDKFEIRRGTHHHLSFGHGVHYCLGAPLARLEAPIAFNTLLHRLRGLRCEVPLESLKWRINLPYRGLHALPITWDRAEERTESV